MAVSYSVTATPATVNVDANSTTFTSQSLGAAASDRYILVDVCGWSMAQTIASVTVAGVTATALIRSVSGDAQNKVAGLFIAAVPSGTTGNIVVDFGGYTTDCSIIVGRATGLDPTPTQTGKVVFSDSADNASFSATVPTGGITIVGGHSWQDTGGTPSWTNGTEVASVLVTGLGTYHEQATRTTAGSATITIANIGGSGAGLVAATFQQSATNSVSVEPAAITISGQYVGTGAESIIRELMGPYEDSYTSLGGDFATWESDFVTYSEAHWSDDGDDWLGGGTANGESGGNYYDRASIWYMMWDRTGNSTYFTRAVAQVENFKDEYGIPNDWSILQVWWIVKGLAIHHALTGSTTSLHGITTLADWACSAYNRSVITDPDATADADPRIAGYSLRLASVAHYIGAPSDAGNDFEARALELLDGILSTQRAGGDFGYTNLDGGTVKPFMQGLLIEGLISYYRLVNADSRIPTAVKNCLDYLWNNCWNAGVAAGSNSFVYITASHNGEDPVAAPDLNMLCVTGFGWYYALTGNTTYKTRGDAVWNGASSGSSIGSPLGKQFNQAYTNSAPYPYYREQAVNTVVVDKADITITGQNVALNGSVPVTPSSVVLTGQNVALIGSVPVSSTPITITGQDVGVPAPANSVTVDKADITITGQEITPTLLTNNVSIEPASIVLTGQSIGVPAVSTGRARGGGSGGMYSSATYKAIEQHEKRRKDREDAVNRTIEQQAQDKPQKQAKKAPPARKAPTVQKTAQPAPAVTTDDFSDVAGLVAAIRSPKQRAAQLQAAYQALLDDEADAEAFLLF